MNAKLLIIFGLRIPRAAILENSTYTIGIDSLQKVSMSPLHFHKYWKIFFRLKEISIKVKVLHFNLKDYSFKPKDYSIKVKNYSFKPKVYSINLKVYSFKPKKNSINLMEIFPVLTEGFSL